LGGGLPRGPVEIYGDASTGKTSLLYRILAQAQQDSYYTVLCHSEYLDLPYMKHLGVNLDQLLLITKNKAENVWEAALRVLEHVNRVVLAIDSATAFRPTDDSSGRWGELIEWFLYRTHSMMNSKSCVVMINQVRMPKSIDPDRSKFFANTPDSAARKIASYFAARLELSRTEVSDHTYKMVTNIVSNTLARPGILVELPFVKGEGVDKELDLVRTALVPEGSWYLVQGDQVQGEKAAANLLRERPAFATTLRRTVMGEAGL